MILGLRCGVRNSGMYRLLNLILSNLYTLHVGVLMFSVLKNLKLRLYAYSSGKKVRLIYNKIQKITHLAKEGEEKKWERVTKGNYWKSRLQDLVYQQEQIFGIIYIIITL